MVGSWEWVGLWHLARYTRHPRKSPWGAQCRLMAPSRQVGRAASQRGSQGHRGPVANWPRIGSNRPSEPPRTTSIEPPCGTFHHRCSEINILGSLIKRSILETAHPHPQLPGGTPSPDQCPRRTSSPSAGSPAARAAARLRWFSSRNIGCWSSLAPHSIRSATICP